MYLFLSIAAALSYTIGGVFMQSSDGLTKLLPSLLIYACFIIGATLHTIATRVSDSMERSFQHLFLSSFRHYRREFSSAAEWAKEHRPQELHS